MNWTGATARWSNLSYFGLLPHAIGAGIGRALLRQAIEDGWARGTRALTVNTCTADHPRALPNYLAAGFAKLRTVREVWHVPQRLGLPPGPAAGGLRQSARASTRRMHRPIVPRRRKAHMGGVNPSGSARFVCPSGARAWFPSLKGRLARPAMAWGGTLA